MSVDELSDGRKFRVYKLSGGRNICGLIVMTEKSVNGLSWNRF